MALFLYVNIGELHRAAEQFQKGSRFDRLGRAVGVIQAYIANAERMIDSEDFIGLSFPDEA
jgi:hypothetical protein